MNAMVLERPGPIETNPLQFSEVATPQLNPDEILLRVTACGVCRTDLHVVEGELPEFRLPLIPGHQVVGVVEKVGTDCRHFKVGDRAGIPWLRSTCGTCAYCETKRENLCDVSTYTGYHEHGGYAEYACAPEAYAYAIPAQFPDIQAAPLLCGGIIGYRALKRTNATAGATVGMYGFGSSAHLTLQVAKYLGMEVVVVTRSADRRELAMELGASWSGGPDETPPNKPDVAIVFSPSGESVPLALSQLSKGGIAVIAGIHLSTIPALNYEQHLFHEKHLTSVKANTRTDGQELLQIAAKIPLLPIVHTYPLADANRALTDLKHGQLDGTAVLIP